MSKATFASSRASRVTELATLLLLLALLTILVLELPDDVFSPESQSFFFAIGAIGAWRYSWWFIHAARSLWYNRVRFPQLRRDADATAQAIRPDELFVLCTSFRIEPEVSFPVYEALVQECANYGVPTTIFASVSDRTDVDVIQHVMDVCGQPANVSVRYMFQRGDGKRSAMAEVLRAISRQMPGPSSLLVSMDGDILLEPGTLERSLPFLLMRSDLGAITTNNRARVTGGDATREWYDLRYAQRHLMMSSMSISERQLVLTGRYSVFRADVAVEREFIQTVESDHIDHWRFGTFKFLSGDDKSTWFCLLKRGWKMLYVPDVYVSGFEELPDRHRFFHSTTDLMRRWYGNMLRTSGRAIQLGPRPMGWFTWWCLVDQRLSMWTTLIGPTVAILVTLFVRPSFIFAYLLWILFTRGIATLVLALQRRRFSVLWLPLLYYNQIFGALLKTYVSFRFNRQAWSRQGIAAGEPDDPRAARRQRRMGHLLHGFHMGALVLVLVLVTGALKAPDLPSANLLSEQLAADQVDTGSDNRWLSQAAVRAPEGTALRLPPGVVALDHQLASELGSEDEVRVERLLGADDGDATVLSLSPEFAAQALRLPGLTASREARVSCPVDAGCALSLGGQEIALERLEVQVL
ncbi:glycosyltransferase family 2 protein [Halomonas sp. H10-59]|uniref:Glycosyltransferase family 2 protein n=1 Tax=Halomonas sp. H10-59 TaxID=2950874 RepID=A0AAU7KXP2_9GAMM